MDNIVPIFETRKPVAADGFHDRDDLLERLSGLVRAHLEGQPSWVALLGPRKIGKTSILRELERRATAESALIVRLDLFKVDTRVRDVFAALTSLLLGAACRSAGRPDLANRIAARPSGLTGGLIHEIAQVLPMDCARAAVNTLEALRSGSVSSADVEAALHLPEHFARELGPVWVIIDEFQELAGLNRQRPFSKRHTVFRLMRSVWQDHEGVSYWATGSQVSMLTSVFTDRRAPLHGYFRLVPVEPFERDQAAELLLRRTRPALRGRDAQAAAELAAEQLGGHPFYVQVLGEELELRRTALTVRGVKAVLQEILLSPAGRLAFHLQGVIQADAGPGPQRAVLRALARGAASLSELVAANPSLTRDATHVHLRRLEGADLVTRDKMTHRFRVADPALAALLRVGGLDAEPPPSVLGDEGEKAAARHLLGQGIRPVYQSYRSLGPADLVVLEHGVRLALLVKRTRLPVYVKESEFQRLQTWSEREELLAVLCVVDPERSEDVRYWRWSEALRAGRRRRFDEATGAATVLELKEDLWPSP